MQEHRKETLATPRHIGVRVILSQDGTDPSIGGTGTVSHLLGSDKVTIWSNIQGRCPVDVEGLDAIRHVRDALTRILRLMAEEKLRGG